MEFPISFIAGMITGLLYNEHIYRQSMRFPGSRPASGFCLRLILTGAVALLIADILGAKYLLAFLAGNLLARLLHTLFRGFLIVRY